MFGPRYRRKDFIMILFVDLLILLTCHYSISFIFKRKNVWFFSKEILKVVWKKKL